MLLTSMAKHILKLTPEQDQELEKIAAQYGITKVEVLRRAIKLLEAVDDERKLNELLKSKQEGEDNRGGGKPV